MLDNVSCPFTSLFFLINIVTVEHVLSPIKCNMGHLTLQATSLTTELKDISTNAVSRGGYGPNMVLITLGRGAFPLQYNINAIWHCNFFIYRRNGTCISLLCCLLFTGEI
jgi:hypothetical protein